MFNQKFELKEKTEFELKEEEKKKKMTILTKVILKMKFKQIVKVIVKKK